METVREENSKEAKHLPSFLQGRKLWIAVSLLLVLLFLIVPRTFFRKGSEKIEPTLGTSEKRIIFSEKELKQVIEAIEKTVPQAKPKSPTNVVRKRNYATEIAVFIYEEKKPEAERPLLGNTSTKLGLPSGTKIKAFLSGTLFSFNVEAPVIAVVSEDALWEGEVVIPKESKFLGEAGVLKSLNRINVNFHELVLPDGRAMRVHAIALSEDGSAGIKGKVRKHRDLKILKAIGEAAIAGGSLFLGGVSRDPYSYEDQLRLNLAQNLTQEARRDLREVKVDRSITAESFTPIQIILLDAV